MSETINRTEISNKASAIKDLLGGEKSFDSTRFNEDAERALADGRSLDSLNIEDYRQKDNNNNDDGSSYNNDEGLNFKRRI